MNGLYRYTHGGDIYSREVRLDFSVNLNPLGIPDSVRLAAANADFSHYPDPYCTALRRKLSQYEGIPENRENRIVCANGAADLIYRLVRAVSPKRALLVSPTFSEYEKALAEQNCEIVFHALSEENGFTLGEDYLTKITPETDMLFLCNPNNPVGNIIPTALLERIAARCSETGTTAVIDECFLDFTQEKSAKNLLSRNVVILKAFTKSCCIAGLRLGYALFGNEMLAADVQNCGQPWSVSSPAQAAGIAAAQTVFSTDFMENTRKLITQERQYLSLSLAELGFKVYPSAANFILFKGYPQLAQRLLERKIAIRRCDDYHSLGEEYFRIAVRTHEENEQLVNAIKAI